jgi:membrane protein
MLSITLEDPGISFSSANNPLTVNVILKGRQLLGCGAGLVSRIKKGLWTAAKVLWSAAFAFVTEEALIRASSLAFTTVISLVPLLTIALRLMNFYGVSSETRLFMEHVVAQYFLPERTRDIVALVFNAANSVTQSIGVVGLLSFGVTLVLMARELEGHVLKICCKTTTWRTSLLHYLAFLILAPTGLLVTILVLEPFLPFMQHMPGFWARVDYPFALSVLVLMTALRAFSGYALGWRASAMGAASSAFTIWAAWRGCIIYFDHSAALSAYGALACFPAFLLWVFVAWCCVLFGIQVAAKAQQVIAPTNCHPTN